MTGIIVVMTYDIYTQTVGSPLCVLLKMIQLLVGVQKVIVCEIQYERNVFSNLECLFGKHWATYKNID